MKQVCLSFRIPFLPQALLHFAELVHLRQNATKDMPDDSDVAPPKKKTKKTGKTQELQIQDDDWSAKREGANLIYPSRFP